MGLFDFLNKDGESQHIPEEKFDDNLEAQIHLAPIALDLLRTISFDEDKELEMEFFFFTNTEEKARNLIVELEKLGYMIYGTSSIRNSISITGRTGKMSMADNIVADWAKQMCELGYIFDCEFDGWGTTPNQ